MSLSIIHDAITFQTGGIDLIDFRLITIFNMKLHVQSISILNQYIITQPYLRSAAPIFNNPECPCAKNKKGMKVVVVASCEFEGEAHPHIQGCGTLSID